MPYNPNANTFSRALTFVDDRAPGDEVTRVDLDSVLDDVETGINTALNQALTYVAEWNPASGAFPTARPDGSAIRARDAWIVSGTATVGGVSFEPSQTLVALVAQPGPAYIGSWLRLTHVTPAAAVGILGAATEEADRAQAWAESATAPDPELPASKSAKTWAAEAEASADRIDLGALDAAVEATAADALATAADRVQTGLDAATALVARTGAEAARDAALLSRGVFASTALGLSNGVAAVTVTGAGNGGANGVFALAFSGGAGTGAAGTFTVASGAVVSVTITHPGTGYTSAPTVSFAASAGLTGVTATVAIAPRNPVGTYFSVPASGDDSLILYRVDAGPVVVEVTRLPASAFVFDRLQTAAITSGVAWAVVDQSGRAPIVVMEDGSIDLPGSDRWQALTIENEALSGITWGVADASGRLALGLNNSGNVVAKGVEVDLSSFGSTVSGLGGVLDSSTIIDCWGDSLTQGNTAGVTVPYPAALATILTGRTVNNLGISGRTSLQIATAFGAVPSILTITNNTIPSSGAVSVTLTENGNFSSKANFGTININGTLFGVSGTLAVAFNSLDPNLAGASTFSRLVSGTAVVIPNRTPFIPATNNREFNTAIIWAGRNDIISGFSNDVILDNIAAMVDLLAPIRKRFAVLSVTDQGSEPSGSAAHTQILALNYELSRRYPRNFIDVRKILVNSYNPALPNDVTAFSQDRVPPSLQQDGLHLNNAGYAIVAQSVANFLIAKGW